MNALKYFFSIAFLITVIAGCKKEVYDDTSFLNGLTDPAKPTVLFNITQDNSGLVTIIPGGEAVTSFDVYYGDSGTAFARVPAGNNAQHKYAEGNYTVKIVGHGANGKTTEMTQPLTVSFRQPENLKTTITTDGLTINVSAKADYETMFRVYYGDSPGLTPEPFETFLEGEKIPHTYDGAGTYTVRIVALSGGVATTEYSQTIKVGKQIDLPVRFEDPSVDYTMSDFGGNSTTLVADPVNPANKVMKSVKGNGAETWAGTTIGTASGFTTKIPVSTTSAKMRMKVYSPAAGIHVRLKLENHGDGTKKVESEAITTVANSWETLTFDFTHPVEGPALDNDVRYDKASVFFDFGNRGDGKTFYWDNVEFVNSDDTPQVLGLPLTFEYSALDYTFTNFDGGSVTIVNNPHKGGINNSAKVAQMVKNGGQTWGGAFIALVAPIDFSTKKTFKMKVYSSKVGAKVLLKVENLTDGNVNFEKEVSTTQANAWEELTFDYSAINTANSYQKIVLIFDNGTKGDGSENFTYLFDDITLN